MARHLIIIIQCDGAIGVIPEDAKPMVAPTVPGGRMAPSAATLLKSTHQAASDLPTCGSSLSEQTTRTLEDASWVGASPSLAAPGGSAWAHRCE